MTGSVLSCPGGSATGWEGRLTSAEGDGRDQEVLFPEFCLDRGERMRHWSEALRRSQTNDVLIVGLDGDMCSTIYVLRHLCPCTKPRTFLPFELKPPTSRGQIHGGRGGDGIRPRPSHTRAA